MRGILLDRDGVINHERADYVKSWDEFRFLPGALAALRQLALLPVPIVIVTNQSVIGRGIVPRTLIDQLHQRLRQVVQAAGGRIDGFFVCPHHPEDGCNCRKPKPGLLMQAATEFRFPLYEATFIGDAITDFQAAQAAGCQSILVRSGRQGTRLSTLLADLQTTQAQNQQQAADGLYPPLVADLSAAAALILSAFRGNS